MSRQDANAAFALTSFLYGTNAPYIEDLYARYEADPKSVDAEWQSFFQSLKDDARDVIESADGPSWRRPDWPRLERSELISALDGDWTEVGKALGTKVKAQAQTKGVELSTADVERATRDSIRALMLIRAYRARGHFHANLDPLGLQPPNDEEELNPGTYGFGEADLDRPIFLDKVLGSRIRHHPRDRRHPAPHLLSDARRRVSAHLRRRAEGLDSGTHRGAGQGDHVHPRGQARDPQQARGSRRLREILRPEIHRHQALRSRRRRVR